MTSIGQAIWSAVLAGVLGACLLLPARAAAQTAPAPITGKLDRRGLVVVALGPEGRVTVARARPGFRLVPPTVRVTLHVRDRSGRYRGPVVVTGRGRRVSLGVRAGMRLGTIEVRDGYARVARRIPRRPAGRRAIARARAGVPIGVGSSGWVRSRSRGAHAPGRDPDRDGIPDRFDVDDDGDLVLDIRERGAASLPAAGRSVSSVSLGACPAAVCSGAISVDLSDADTADVALIVAIAAALLAAAAMALQLLASRRRRAKRPAVDLRLGLPIYQQGGGDWAIFIEVVNLTDHPVRWVSAALELSEGRRLYLMQPPPGGELPAVLQPHDSHQTWTPCPELERAGLDLSDRVVAIAKLDSGEQLRSPRRRLVPRSRRRLRR